MASTLPIGNILAEAARHAIANDRHAFLPALRAVEQFAVERGAVLGGRTAIFARAGAPLLVDYDLWELDAYFSARDCARSGGLQSVALDGLRAVRAAIIADAAGGAAEYGGNVATLLAKVVAADRDYDIYIDGRKIARFHALGEHKGVDVMRMFAPSQARGPFGTANALIMPPIAQILRIAHSLCDAGAFDTWPALVRDLANEMRALADLRDPFATRVGGVGADTALRAGGAPAVPPAPETIEWSDGVEALDGAAVVCGERAARFYYEYDGAQLPAPRDCGRRQYLCVTDGLAEYANERDVRIVMADPRMPDDGRLRRTSLHRADSHIADLYNAPEYDPIPIVREGHTNTGVVGGGAPYSAQVRVAAPFCVLRFLFVDIWALSFIIAMRGAGAGAGNRSASPEALRRAELLGIARKLFSWICSARVPTTMIFPHEYYGTFVSEATARRARAPSRGPPPILSIATHEEIVDTIQKMATTLNAL